MLDHQLREKYRGVYGMILRELNPSGHARERRTRATLARLRSEYAAREAAARKQRREDDRKMWQQVGGLVSS